MLDTTGLWYGVFQLVLANTGEHLKPTCMCANDHGLPTTHSTWCGFVDRSIVKM